MTPIKRVKDEEEGTYEKEQEMNEEKEDEEEGLRKQESGTGTEKKKIKTLEVVFCSVIFALIFMKCCLFNRFLETYLYLYLNNSKLAQ